MGIPIGSENVEKRASTGERRGKSVGKGEDVFLRIVEVANGGKKRRLQPATLRCSTVTGLQFPQTEREREAILALRKPSLDILFSSQI